MKIDIKDNKWLRVDGKLVRQVLSPQSHTNGPFRPLPKVIVVHFTYGSTAESSANWFRDPRNEMQSSAHVIIDRNGSIIQCVPFDTGANHAGKSSWRGIHSLNDKSFGIELANWGFLVKTGTGYVSWTGRAISNYLLADHKNGNPHSGYRPFAWETYTEEQFRIAAAVARAIVARFGANEIVGHDDISPQRKHDPGPAFDMRAFRDLVFGGRALTGPNTVTVQAEDGLRLRAGPGTEFESLEVLPHGSPLEPMESKGNWLLVNTINKRGQPSLTGWVHSRFVSFT